MAYKPLEHLSASQIGMYLRCPRQWAYRYLEGLKVPPSGAMKLSGVGHTAIERNYKQKVTTRTDLPMDDMTDFYADTWETELEREEVVFDKGETADGLRDVGIAAVKEHHRVIAPKVMALSEATIEEPFNLPLVAKDPLAAPVTYRLVGRIDLTDDQNIIRDHKILGRRPSPDDVARDGQLSTYALAKRLQTKQAERGLALDVVVKNKKPVAITIPAERSREFLLEHLNTIGHVARGIEAGVFPRNVNGWHCSPKFCGYWSRCVGKHLKTVDLGENLQEQLEGSLDGSAK